MTLEYEMTNGSLSYVDIASLPASATWKQYMKTFKTPKNAVSVSVFHHVDSIGFLNTDNFSLVLGT